MPFDSTEFQAERVTEWRCRGRVSTHRDNCQENPYQRISSKSSVGKTWFFPKEQVSEERIKLSTRVGQAPGGVLRAMQYFVEQAGNRDAQKKRANEILDMTKDLLKPERVDRSARASNPTLLEFCCDKDSTLGQANQEQGINHFRLSTQNSDLSDPWEVDSLCRIIKQFPGCDLWGSIPCGPWSQWQRVNKSQYGHSFAQAQKGA